MFYFQLPNGTIKPIGYDLTAALAVAAPTCSICGKVVIINEFAQVVTTVINSNGTMKINATQLRTYTDVHLFSETKRGGVFQLSALN